MKSLYLKFIILYSIILFSNNILAQNTFNAVIKNEKTKEIVSDVSVFLVGTQNSSTSDENGNVTIENIPNGKQTIVFN